MPLHDGTKAANEATEKSVPIVQETISVAVRPVQSVGARVHITVSEHDETVQQLLIRQDATIERIPVGRTVAETPLSRREGDVFIVPVMEEVLVVEKRLVLKEELHIRITETRTPTTETVTLRREHAEIVHGDVVAKPNGEVA